VICGAESGPCRERDIAKPLGLRPNPRSPGDFEGNCPECGHGGFALSQPTLTKMRNMWSCNCKICNGGRGCLTRVTRAAMIRKNIPAACLGTYIGKDHREVPSETVRKMTQTIDDILNCPSLNGAEIRLLLGAARGDEIPDEYGPCASYLMSIGLGRSNAYNLAERETRGRPSDQSPPQTGGRGVDTSRTTQGRNRVKPLRSEARNSPENGQNGSESSENWTERTPSEPPDSPKIGQRTQGNTNNRRPAA
jgi:hypothetical protein